MTFYGYKVDKYRFGCGEKAKALACAKALNKPVEVWKYKI